MVNVGIQLYTLRNVDASLTELLDRVGDAGYDGVEFAHRVRDADPDAVRDAIARNDLDAASAHVGIEALADDYEATVAHYDAVGCDTLVVPWLDAEHFTSAESIAAVAERLDALAATLEDDGFALAYHNHDQEFVPFEGGTAMDELLARTDDRVGFEIDLGWASVGGVDPAAYVDRYADRITHVHFADADVETGESRELGEGDVDIDAVAAAASAAGVDWYVYENEHPADPDASLEHGVATLGRLG